MRFDHNRNHDDGRFSLIRIVRNSSLLVLCSSCCWLLLLLLPDGGGGCSSLSIVRMTMRYQGRISGIAPKITMYTGKATSSSSSGSASSSSSAEAPSSLSSMESPLFQNRMISQGSLGHDAWNTAMATTTSTRGMVGQKKSWLRRKWLAATSSSSNGNGGGEAKRDLSYQWSPTYLEKIDQYRGYKRRNKRYVNGYMLNGATKKNATSLAIPIVNLTTTATMTSTTTTSDRIYYLIKAVMRRIVSPEMIHDVKIRSRVYVSDWTDAFWNMKKVIPAIMFLYFSCLSPVVSFGTIASQITMGNMGIVEFLLSAGLSGVAYAMLCGQPMAFIAPTGLTLAFISGLFRFCTLNGLPFFPVYSWVGLWTSLFFMLLGLGGSSQLIRFCTRFTDEIFNALLSINFIYEALASLKRNFELADPHNLTKPFVSLAMALTTFWSTMKVSTFESSKYFNQKVRTIIKDFGPVTVFLMMSLLNHQPWVKKFAVSTLTVPSKFELAGGRGLFVNLNAIPLVAKVLCAFPAVLLTSLFFMDQNISVRVVNNSDNKLQKGAAYNLDMLALGIITGGLSLVGLPWMCGATVQSLNHVRAMTETRFNEETQSTEIVKVTETRFTGFFVHAMIAGTVGLLPLLRVVPIPVVSGIFLFLGRRLMSGNAFLSRLRDGLVEKSRLPEDHPILVIGRRKTHIFTLTQVACLYGLWVFKQNNSTALFFPSVIGFLMLIRSYILPKFFTEDDLIELGDPTPTW